MSQKQAAAGYSGTPLAKKLGYVDGLRVYMVDMPESVRAEIEMQASPDFINRPGKQLPAAHVFATEAKALERQLSIVRTALAPDGMVWVSWPKKAAKVPTDITEDAIRAIALPMGLVDVKVCAIDATWSGLKLVIRKQLR